VHVLPVGELVVAPFFLHLRDRRVVGFRSICQDSLGKFEGHAARLAEKLVFAVGQPLVDSHVVPSKIENVDLLV